MIDLFIFKPMSDPTVKRHLLKTVTWRIIGSFDTVVLGWVITSEFSTGLKIGGLELLTKMVLYFLHERAWNKIRFGVMTRENNAVKVRDKIAPQLFTQELKISKQQREELNQQKSFTLWLTGLPASGKSSIAAELDARLFGKGYRTYVLDGDNTRLGINSDLSFSKEDRKENIRRVSEICKLMNDAGVIVIASFISPYEEDRQKAKSIIGDDNFIETFVDASVDTCKTRDKKGLYKLAEQGKIKNYTGVNSPYEKPVHPDIHIQADSSTVAEGVEQVIASLLKLNKLTKQHTATRL